MTREEIFEAWAPAGAVWSQWTKPVLFAGMGPSLPEPEGPSGLIDPSNPDWRSSDVSFAPRSNEVAIVADLPGVASLATGLALTARGYRPVPLFNACDGPNAACDLGPLVRGLQRWAEEVRAASLPPDAPPAFLIDSQRLSPARSLTPGTFDNRWVVFPQDFPSGNFLRSRGIRRVLLVQMSPSDPAQDLAHVLLRWQEAGIAIEAWTRGTGDPMPIQVKRPSWFRSLWARFLIAAGLRRSAAGGFGAAIPVQTSGGGYS